MSFDKLAKRYGVKAVYKIFKEGKIVLGVLAESEEVDLESIAKSFNADDAVLVRLDDPKTRYPVLNGILLVSVDDEYRKSAETEILEKAAEMKLKNIEKAIDELIRRRSR